MPVGLRYHADNEEAQMTSDETGTTPHQPPTVAEALQGWRSAERVAAVARRGRLAAQAAAQAAAEAAEAALATSEAAKAALDSMTLAEQSATKTAIAARLVAETAQVEAADSESDVALADLGEAEAKEEYRRASKRATGVE
jgi:hypothetical protein